MRKVFLEKSFTKCGGEISPRPFSKKSKLSMFLEQQSKVLHSLFSLCVQVDGYRNISNLRYRHLLLPHEKFFCELVWN